MINKIDLTRGGSGGHDRTLATKRRKMPENQLLSSSYAKILGETNFQSWEIPRSGSKAKDGKEKEIRETESW